ncbi:MAG: HAMP domain-containing histidine kinase [Hyphomicrobiaceae bacterium]|nr:HAMP domain-containing histidine kinase [Hyphomicrobiaceae bacterium]
MQKTSRSIRLRLVAAALLTIFMALSAAGTALVLLFEHHVERRVVADLEADMGQLLAGLSVAGDGKITLARRPAEPLYAQPFSGTYWQIEAAGIIAERSRSLWDEKISMPVDDPGGGIHEHVVIGPQGRPLVAVERAVRVETQSGVLAVRIVVAQDRAATMAAVESFLREIAWMLLVLGVLLLAAFAVAIGVGIAPFRRLRSDLAELRTGAAQRLTGSYPSEVRLLVDEMNKLLEDRERAAERKRQRAADLAHGLKTPITAISGIADEFQRSGQASLARELHDNASAMLRHVERELALARTTYSGPAAVPTPLLPVIETLVRSLARLPRGRDIAWEIDVPGEVMLRIDRTALAEIFGGLLDNARKWAQSRVRLEAVTEGGCLVVRISDNGPGVAEADLAVLTARGKRLDQRQPGSGLGLAIAADIVEELGGTLTLANRPTGGLLATVTLPVE